jgi:hypothetical protein
VLLHRQRKVRSSFDRGVVGDEHALLAFDHADSGHDAGGGCLVLVDAPGRERRELEEGRVRIEQAVDALARGQLPARTMPFDCLLAAPLRNLGGPLVQLGDKLLHPFTAPLEVIALFDARSQYRHRKGA